MCIGIGVIERFREFFFVLVDGIDFLRINEFLFVEFLVLESFSFYIYVFVC